MMFEWAERSRREMPVLESYRHLAALKMLFLLALVVFLILSILIALSRGASSISTGQALTALWGGSEKARIIVWKLRLPRIVMALLVGWGLALGGTVCQAVLRNPLASPFTLGVASGASFGAVLGILWGHGRYEQGLIAFCAFAFALLTALAVLSVSRFRNAGSETLILAGVAAMFLFSSLTSLLQYTATMEEVHAVVFWLFGSLSKAGWKEIVLTSLMILPPAFILLNWSWDLNLLAAGDESAESVGVNVPRLRMMGIFLAALMSAGAICFTGVIGFIGLVSPHIGRMILGADHRYLFPASGLIGALLVLNADTLSRTVWPPQVIPIGIVTSFIGIPFFLYLLIRQTKEYW